MFQKFDFIEREKVSQNFVPIKDNKVIKGLKSHFTQKLFSKKFRQINDLSNKILSQKLK